LVIKAGFQDAGVFANGLAQVRNKNHWGYIGTDGQWRIPPRYRRAMPFRAGLALVEYEGGWQYLNEQGDVVWRES